MGKTYYEILGIKKSASPEEIKEAYYKLITKYHPDRNPGDKKAEEFTKEINGAHAELSNGTKKYYYDLKLAKERKERIDNLYKAYGQDNSQSYSQTNYKSPHLYIP